MSPVPCRTRVAACVTVPAVAIAVVLGWPHRPAVAAAADRRPPALVEAQRQEVDALRAAVALAVQLFAHGLGPAEDIDRLNRTLIQERLRMAASADERVAALREGLTAAKAQEELATSRFQAGLVSDLAPTEAKAFRLGIQEQLLEAGAN